MTETFDKYEKKGAYHWDWYRQNTGGYRDLVRATLAHLPRSGSILDVGCGDGLLTYLLFRRGLFAQGIDPNARGVWLGRQEVIRRYRRTHGLRALIWKLMKRDPVAELARRGFSLSVGTVDDLSPNKHYDYGLCHEVIEHVPNPKALVDGIMARVTRFALFTSPNGLHRQPREYDYQFWTPQSFPSLFEGRRVELIEVNEDRIVAKVHSAQADLPSDQRLTSKMNASSQAPTGLIRRLCPLCGADAAVALLSLPQEAFITPNPAYRRNRLHELGLDPEMAYPIVRCKSCGMIYTLYRLTPDREHFLYEQIIDRECSQNKVLTVERRILDIENWMHILKAVRSVHPGRLALRVADYGCGWATILQAARGVGVEVFGFDVTSWKTEWAKAQGVPIFSTFEELARQGPYDVCISTSVVEHLDKPMEAMQQMASILRSDGLAYVTGIVGSVASLAQWDDMRTCLRRGAPIPKEVNPWEHLNYFTEDTLGRMMNKAGFQPLAGNYAVWHVVGAGAGPV